ncbi:probable inactive ATP-dependent zinc metalloprotease FTSHI 3, chloroplastic isoform X1 [Hibiscus syriacus]|uniref:probable inactive ATP-dependent zinc metalloprotease FTSHI 3, chloroplastic isoform X1 n=1 Tax=Hibiscus syriacus TaxID=106335 RepID=UPI00192279D0|nr:probable inactive ATP-dependent zinc metalloprotease FTSHI 3, chloroplastic isoform X1 [Hibiscus syriacus]
MACFSIVCNYGCFVSEGNLVIDSGKTKSIRRYTGFSYTSVCFPSLGIYSYNHCKTQNLFFSGDNSSRFISNGRSNEVPSLGFRVCCKAPNGLLMKGNSGDKETQFGKGGSSRVRKIFSVRLRPRLRLLTRRMKRLSVRSMLNDVAVFLRKNIRRVSLYSTITLVLGMCYLFLKLTAVPSPKIVPYSEFITSLQSSSVTKVLLEEGSRRIYFNMDSKSDENTQSEEESSARNDSTENLTDMVAREDGRQLQNQGLLKRFSKPKTSTSPWMYLTRKIDHDEKFLLSLMREKGTTYSSAPQSVLMAMRSTLITIISLWIPLMPLMWLLYRQLSAANSPAKKRRPNNQVVGFDDVEGVDTAKVELMEVVSCLQGSVNYQKLGAKLPRGVLLVGPPGTGKTLLARAVAGEAGVPFFSVSASEFVELFVGRGAARIRDLFNVARKSAPSIIFIDELDAVGGKRGRSFNDERDQTLNQLLTEMDGFESDMKVVVIGATNRPEALDPALCRPGRFSRKVLVGEPNEEGRRKILAVHLRGVSLEEDPQLISELVASLTPGFVGADLANIVNEAALLAARRGGETVTREDIMEAVERAKFGINDRQPSIIGKELGKLFPWVPYLMGRSDPRQDGLQGPLGYQTLS